MFIKRFFSKLHRVSNVLIVLAPAKITTSRGCFWMRSFDLDATHFSLFCPKTLNGPIGQEVGKAQETKVNEVVVLPLLNPSGWLAKLIFWNRNLPVVVDDQLSVSCNANIKFDAVEHHDGMA